MHHRLAARIEPVVLRLKWAIETDPSQASLGAVALLDAIAVLDTPLDLSFRLTSTGGSLQAALVVGAVNQEATERAAQHVFELAAACLPCYRFELVHGRDAEPFALPDGPVSACWFTAHGKDRPRVSMSSASPLASLMPAHDAIVAASARLAFPEGEAVRGADLVVASSSQPVTEVSAALALELGGLPVAGVRLLHAAGGDATTVVAHHGMASNRPLPDTAIAVLLSVPARARERTGWARLPAAPVEHARLLEAARSKPEMHTVLLGASGAGKTTFLEHRVIGDASEGKAILVIDPHGELVRRLAETLPPERAGDIDLVDLGSDDPPSLNVLAHEPGQDVDAVVAEVAELVRSLFETMSDDLFGPVFHRVLRWAVRAELRGAPDPSLRGVVRVLSGDTDYVESLLLRAADENLTRVWHTEMAMSLGTPKERDYTTWVASKLDPLVSDRRSRLILAPAESAARSARRQLSLARIIEERRIALVRIPVGELGATATLAIGTALLQRAIGVLGRRLSSATGTPPPLAVHVDEFHRVAETTVRRLLAEGRKFGFELTVAAQSIGQLHNPATILANAGTVAAFRLGPIDAAVLEAQYASVSAAGLRALPPHWAAIRAPDGGEAVGPCPPPAPARPAGRHLIGFLAERAMVDADDSVDPKGAAEPAGAPASRTSTRRHPRQLRFDEMGE